MSGLPWKPDQYGVLHATAGGWHGIVDPRGRNHCVWIVEGDGIHTRRVVDVPYSQPLDDAARAQVVADAKAAVEAELRRELLADKGLLWLLTPAPSPGAE